MTSLRLLLAALLPATPIMGLSNSCTLSTPEFRYSSTSNRLYAEGPGCFTKTDLHNYQWKEDDGVGPVYVLGGNNNFAVEYPGSFNGKWLLTSELFVTGGDNEFTGTDHIEFDDAQDTNWSSNVLPSETCLKNQDGSSTFVGSSGLPASC